jgi:hypothetical protein
MEIIFASLHDGGNVPGQDDHQEKPHACEKFHSLHPLPILLDDEINETDEEG